MGEIIDKVKGKLKQAVGSATGDSKLEREGKIDEALDDVKASWRMSNTPSRRP